jgi:hypothetical protein
MKRLVFYFHKWIEQELEDTAATVMTAEEIPAFVREVIATGCDICDIGHTLYCIGDADLSTSELETVAPELARIWSTYGTRDHLRLEIVAHLRSLGRYVDPFTVH